MGGRAQSYPAFLGLGTVFMLVDIRFGLPTLIFVNLWHHRPGIAGFQVRQHEICPFGS